MEIVDIEPQIQQDVASHRQMHGKLWGYKFFNNFHLNLPGGYIKSYDSEMLNEYGWRDSSQCSERKRSKTVADFFAECELAAAEAGLTSDALEAFRHDLNTNGTDCVDQSVLLPAYIILRKMGYNHYPDLTS